MNITFVNCLLTPPRLEGQLPLKWDELCQLIQANFSGYRIAEFQRLRSLADLDNLRAYWSRGDFNPCGNWTGDQQVADSAPPFFQKALQSYSGDEGLKHTFGLMVNFFAEDAARFGEKSWISRYFRCELAMRLQLANLRALALGKKLDSTTLDSYREGNWEFLNRCLLSACEEFPSHFSQIEELYRTRRKEPLELSRDLSQWRLDLIEELAGRVFLSWERLLAISAQYMICEDWQRMSRERGLAALSKQRAQDALPREN